jgi:hypothetical protein
MCLVNNSPEIHTLSQGVSIVPFVRAGLALKLEEFFKKKALENKQAAIKKADVVNPKKNDSFCQNSDKTKTYEPIQIDESKKNIFKTQKRNCILKAELTKPDTKIEPVDTKKELAKIAGVSHDTLAKAKKIEGQDDRSRRSIISLMQYILYTAIKTLSVYKRNYIFLDHFSDFLSIYAKHTEYVIILRKVTLIIKV